MAYSVTGTAGNDTLDQGSDTGPGTIVGLAGDDQITVGSGLATVTGDSGNDNIALQTGNTGTVNGGTENDMIGSAFNIGSMQLFGGDGGDVISVGLTTANQTIVGGNDSNDGADNLSSGSGADLVFGNGGDDILLPGTGNDTTVGGFGIDNISDAGGSNFAFGNQGNDIIQFGGTSANTGYGGLGDDLISAGGGPSLLFGNEGGDNIIVGAGATVVGGDNSADGDDMLGGTNQNLAFGNGGNDQLAFGGTGNTLIGGFGNDRITGGPLVFANEGNDTVQATNVTANTVFGGLGNDSIVAIQGRDTIQGNEGNDTIRAGFATIDIDTISGGAGNDVFAYLGAGAAGEDGNNATGGGPVEFITDVDFAADRFDTEIQVVFAANMGAGTGGTLAASANNALAAADALNGGGVDIVAAQFTFAGRTYLAIDQANGGAFDDAEDLLLDITGATGTIATGNFV